MGDSETTVELVDEEEPLELDCDVLDVSENGGGTRAGTEAGTTNDIDIELDEEESMAERLQGECADKGEDWKI